MLLSNAFSLQMLTGTQTVKFTFISEEDARFILVREAWTSVVGHKDLAEILSNMFGITVPVNRVSNKLHTGDKMLVAQFMGGRLPEGATTLPEGASIQFILVEVE